MEAEIYGMIPKAKTEALAKAPPVNAFNKPNKPDSVLLCNFSNLAASIPGKTTCAPKRYTSNRPRVNMILFLNSSIFQTFFSVSINFMRLFVIIKLQFLLLQLQSQLLLKR